MAKQPHWATTDEGRARISKLVKKSWRKRKLAKGLTATRGAVIARAAREAGVHVERDDTDPIAGVLDRIDARMDALTHARAVVAALPQVI